MPVPILAYWIQLQSLELRLFKQIESYTRITVTHRVGKRFAPQTFIVESPAPGRAATKGTRRVP